MKNRVFLLGIFLLFVCFLGGKAFGQPMAECQSTLKCWLMDPRYRDIASKYYCPNPRAHTLPILKPEYRQKSRSAPQRRAPRRRTARPKKRQLSASEQAALGIFGSIFSSIGQDIANDMMRWFEGEPQQQAIPEPRKPIELTPEEKAARKARREKALSLRRQRYEKEEPVWDKSLGGLEAFRWDKTRLVTGCPSTKTGKFDNSGLSSWQRLLCANQFSVQALSALNDGDEERAKYLNEQAEMVSSGQPTELKCEFPALYTYRDPTTKVDNYVDILDQTQENMKALEEIEIKAQELKEQKKQAEGKKERAKKALEELRALDAVKPEDKETKRSLEDVARRLLQEAETELESVNERWESLARENTRIQEEIKQANREVRERYRSK